MEYTESHLPLELKDGEYLTLADGSTVRWESNGEAKNVFLGSGFGADAEIFPECSWEFSSGGATYRLTARFDNALLVERL